MKIQEDIGRHDGYYDTTWLFTLWDVEIVRYKNSRDYLVTAEFSNQLTYNMQFVKLEDYPSLY